MHPEVEAFYNGTSFGCHRLLGARPAGRGWRFTVWAPHARRVQVLGDWNGWDLYTAAELAACEDGLWRGTVPAAAEGQLYKYNLLGPDGVWRMRPDLFARDGEALPGTASRLTLPPAPPPRRPGQVGVAFTARAWYNTNIQRESLCRGGCRWSEESKSGGIGRAKDRCDQIYRAERHPEGAVRRV